MVLIPYVSEAQRDFFSKNMTRKRGTKNVQGEKPDKHYFQNSLPQRTRKHRILISEIPHNPGWGSLTQMLHLKILKKVFQKQGKIESNQRTQKNLSANDNGTLSSQEWQQ